MALNVYSLERDGEKSLSKNFKVKEFRCKDGSDPIFIVGCYLSNSCVLLYGT